MTADCAEEPAPGAGMNREVRQYRRKPCNSRTGVCATGDSRAKQRPRHSPVQDPNKPRPRHTERYTTPTPQHEAAASPPPPPPLPPPPPPLPPPRTPSISSWRAIFSKDYGQLYFYNANTGETTWEPPPKSRGLRGVMTPPFVDEKNIGATRCGTVTVRSRSLVSLSKGGRIKHRTDSPVSLRSDRGRDALVGQPREENLEAADGTGTRGRAAGVRTTKNTSIRRKDNVAVIRGTRSLPGKVADPDMGVTERQSRAQRKPLGKDVDNTNQGPKGKRRGATHPEETTPAPRRRGETETLRRKDDAKNMPPKAGNPEQPSRARGLPTSLLQAEKWLAQNELEAELERPRSRALIRSERARSRSKSSRRGTRRSCTPVGSRGERVRADAPQNDEASGATTTRLRGRAAAVWASVEAQRREEEEMTGTPEITRLGRSKQRSVDDLFLFQREVEASRRRKRDEREAHEDNLVTGRPATCGRSTVLVEQMRRDDANRTQLSTSKRLYGNAREQRRRQETLQMQVETAIRRRANPTISVRSRSLPRNRQRHGDAARRLYEQAVASREEALQRERHLAQNLPRGVTFHPEIHHRSTFLAQRRRERWALAVGLGVSGSEGGSVAAADPAAVQEFLLAEGALYDRRRQERQSRQEQVALRCKSPTVNRYSRVLLRKAERMGRSVGTPFADSRVPGDVADVDSRKHEFSPRLQALDTSKRMLESRYGRGSIPSMGQRAKERERERMEREAQSDERNKENRIFVAKRTVRSSPESGNAEQSRGADIYERTKGYLRQKEDRWASEREALLAEELADCTFEPELRTKRRGRSRHRQRFTPNANGLASFLSREVSGVEKDEGVGHEMCAAERDGVSAIISGSGGGGGGGTSGPRRESDGSVGMPNRRRRRSRQQASDDRERGRRSSSFVGEEEKGGGRRSIDCSVGSTGYYSKRESGRVRGGRSSEDRRSLSSLRTRRQSEEASGDGSGCTQEDYLYSVYDSTEGGSDHLLLHEGDAASSAGLARDSSSRHSSTSGTAVTTETIAEASGTDGAAASPLPRGWTAFTSPEGWAYFFHEETSVVQWKRPTR